MSISFGTVTVPTVQTRPKSFRRRSTIIRFSARFLGQVESTWDWFASSFFKGRRGSVPFIGWEITTRSLSSLFLLGERERKRSGEEQQIVTLEGWELKVR